MENTQMTRKPVFNDAVLDDLDLLIADREGDEILETIEEQHSDEIIEEQFDEPPVETVEAADISEKVEVIEELEPHSILNDLDMESLNMDLAKQEAYEEQSAETNVTISDPADIAAASAAKPKRARKAATAPAKKRTVRDLNSIEAKYFATNTDPETVDEAALATYKDSFIKGMPAQVKVRDKIELVMCGIASGNAPNRYVEIPFRLLIEKGTITHSDIMAAYKVATTKDGAKNLNAGTAAAQTGQIMVLFPYLGIASLSGKKELTLCSDSRVAAELKTLFAI